ncbi:MAG: hypothetical protein KBC74_03860 [Candidatus Pacebacteria bacterium]|nr:hypothetical protein [Candidatus Paceibacterota bacterium]MBP9832622.1 hypothetical protein [Candidatus Paceibacterota bacterium]
MSEFTKSIQAQRGVLAGLDRILNASASSKKPLSKNAEEAVELVESLLNGFNRLLRGIEGNGTIICAGSYSEPAEEYQSRLLEAMRELDGELTLMTVPDLF